MAIQDIDKSLILLKLPDDTYLAYSKHFPEATSHGTNKHLALENLSKAIESTIKMRMWQGPNLTLNIDSNAIWKFINETFKSLEESGSIDTKQLQTT